MLFNPKHLKYYHFKLSIKTDQFLVSPNLWNPLFFTHLSLGGPHVSAHTVFKGASFLSAQMAPSIHLFLTCQSFQSERSDWTPLTSLLVPSNCLGPYPPIHLSCQSPRILQHLVQDTAGIDAPSSTAPRERRVRSWTQASLWAMMAVCNLPKQLSYIWKTSGEGLPRKPHKSHQKRERPC